ncbi:MAG: hypothetical protein ACLPV8_29820 [Steroidobacteraceae bacterium]
MYRAALFAMVSLAAALPSAALEREIFPAPEQAAADLAAALKVAVGQHRRVILDFGGDWRSRNSSCNGGPKALRRRSVSESRDSLSHRF